MLLYSSTLLFLSSLFVAFSLPIYEDFMVKLMGKMEERAIALANSREERIKTIIIEQIEVAITELGK